MDAQLSPGVIVEKGKKESEGAIENGERGKRDKRGEIVCY